MLPEGQHPLRPPPRLSPPRNPVVRWCVSSWVRGLLEARSCAPQFAFWRWPLRILLEPSTRAWILGSLRQSAGEPCAVSDHEDPQWR